MCPLLEFEADRRCFLITINSFNTELTKDVREKLYPTCGKLYPEGLSMLNASEDFEQVWIIPYDSNKGGILSIENHWNHKIMYNLESLEIEMRIFRCDNVLKCMVNIGHFLKASDLVLGTLLWKINSMNTRLFLRGFCVGFWPYKNNIFLGKNQYQCLYDAI